MSTPIVPPTSAPAAVEAESLQEPSTAPAPAAETTKPAEAEPSAQKVSRAISAALHEKKQRIAAETRTKALEAELAQAKTQATEASAKLNRFKDDPLGALEAVGMTYEEITKAAIAKHGKDTPAARIEAIEAKIKADETARAKAQEEDTKTRQQQEAQAKVDKYVGEIVAHAESDKTGYELIAAMEPAYVKQLMHDVADGMCRRDGKVPTAKEVCDSIESHFEEQGVKLASAGKVKSKLAPKVEEPPKTEAEPVQNPAVARALEEHKKKTAPRTLTNKLAAAPQEKPPAEAGKKLSPQEAMKLAMAAFRESQSKQSA